MWDEEEGGCAAVEGIQLWNGIFWSQKVSFVLEDEHIT